jgi:Ni/Fe-hydrogenase subunit HybB-like protein
MLFVATKGKWLAIISGIVAGIIVIFEGWILSMSAGAPLWHGGMMPGIFLVEGILVALAVTIVSQFGRQSFPALRRWLLVLLPVLFLLNLFQIGASLYVGELEDLGGTRLMLSYPLFWLEVVLGIIVPFVLLMWFHKNRTVVIVSAVLVVLGVFVAKSLTLAAGQALSFLMGTMAYTPTIVEIGGVVGAAGLAGLLYLVGIRLLPKK